MNHRPILLWYLRRGGRPESVGYLNLGAPVLFALAYRDRLHEEPYELPTLPERLRRVLLDFGDSLAEREQPSVGSVGERRPLVPVRQVYLDRL